MMLYDILWSIVFIIVGATSIGLIFAVCFLLKFAITECVRFIIKFGILKKLGQLIIVLAVISVMHTIGFILVNTIYMMFM
jgi:hypothetical protein